MKRNVCCTFKGKKSSCHKADAWFQQQRASTTPQLQRGLAFAIPRHSGRRSWTPIKNNSNTILPPLLPHSLSQMSWTTQWLMELVINLHRQSAVVIPLSWRWTFTFGSYTLLNQLNLGIATASSTTILRHVVIWSLAFGHGDPPSQML